MRKLIIGGSILLLAVVVLGFGLQESLPFTAGNKESLEEDNEIEDTYLKLFREYKKSNLTIDDYTVKASRASNAQNRNPFLVPELKLSSTSIRKNGGSSRKSKAVRQKPLQLTGILWDETKPGAVINNKVVHPDSRIGVYKVVGILPDNVILASNSKRVILKLPRRLKN